MSLLRQLVARAACGRGRPHAPLLSDAAPLSHASAPQSRAAGAGAPDRADVGGAHDRTEVSAATRRIVSQLELARRDARARTLRATTLPISIGVFLSVCSIGVWTRGTAPGASGWLDPAAAALGALGWSGFLSGLDPTSDVMPLVGALVLLGFNSFSALALVGAVLAVLASVPAECSALGDALVADGILASACIIFTAGVVAPAACLASWRAATSDGAAQRARCVGGLPPITTRRLVDVVWICSGCTYAGLSAGVLYAAAVKLAFGLPGVLPELLSMAVSVTTALLWWSTAVRVRVHALLISGGEHVATAAGITTLLGGVDATTVQTSIATARERFRAIPFRALDESALAQAAPAGRHANYCAFISHSWWDPAPSKWAALRTWAAGFEREHDRQPMVWVDRACIDQVNVAAELQYLPIYLAACKQLVVLAGPTYLSRMWCIVELFVYDQMWPSEQRAARAAAADDDGELGQAEPTAGAQARKVTMLLLPGLRAEDFATFDAAQAETAARSDYERLLRCVEVCCGSVESFNVRARQLLAGAFRIEHGEDGERCADGARALGHQARAARASAGFVASAAAASECAQPSGGGWRAAEGDGGLFRATVWLWARAWALGLALFVALGARAIQPALDDCARISQAAAR